MAGVSIRNLSKRYGKFAALNDVSLEIRQGELIVLVGPSGCGKSTLLRSIAGLDQPTEGEIRIGEKRVNEIPPAERGIGMVFQDYALYPHMTVQDNLTFGLKIRGLAAAEIRERVAESAKMLQLEELLERRPAQLSGGQRQRVAIGRALVKHPSVLLLDEPLSNLDAQLRAQTRLEIAALHRRIGSTTVYVTHDQEEAMTLADRIVVLNKGAVQQVNAPAELYRTPRNRFVASFIGSPRMNFLEGELMEERNGQWQFLAQGQSFTIRGPHPPKSGRYLLGFRPEAAHIGKGALRAKLTWVENHGYESHVIGAVGESQVILRSSEANPKENEFSFDIEPLETHWFDPDGARISMKSA